MLFAATSKEGISLELKEDNNAVGLPLEDLSDDEGGENEEEISLDTDSNIAADFEQIKSINVENAFKEEKETAIRALKDICVSCGPKGFGPFISKCLEECWILLEYPHEDIRSATIDAVTHFVMAYYIGNPDGFGQEHLFTENVVKLVPALIRFVREDELVTVVCTALEMLGDLLKSCGPPICAIPNYPEEIVQSVHVVIKSQCACMDSDTSSFEEENGDNDDGSEEAEQDELLFEYAGDILPNLGTGLNDPARFAVYFAGVLPHLLKKTRKNVTIAKKLFAAGTLAKCMQPLAGALEPFVVHIFPALLGLTRTSFATILCSTLVSWLSMEALRCTLTFRRFSKTCLSL